MTVRIRIDHGQGAGKTWRLAKKGVYTLGRTPASTIWILDNKVSKDHCEFHVRGDGDDQRVVLKDLDSRSGTLVNGQPLATKIRLNPGDEIRLGLSILRVLSDGEADVEAEPVDGEAAVSSADLAAGTPKKQRKTFAPDQLVGEEVGGYRVKEKIGQGGMGSVYVAEQLSLHREVAFKVLNQKLTSDRTFVDQFVNEARSAAALNHPNVVQVYDVGREGGRYYFSMEFVSGGSLEEKLSEDGPAEWQVGLNWFIDSSNALIFAQRREILHRDVKPDNLMLAEDGSAKLCDLGLAKKAANEDMLAAGIIGTPAFISPEAIRRKKDINVRSDLYSLGCTFYRLLTGENPYPGKSVKEILLGHLNAPVPRVSAKKPDIPRDLDDVIYKLMQKEPEARYQTPQDLLEALDKIRVQHGLEKHGLRPASRKPLLIALAVVILLGAAAVIFAVTREPEFVVPVKTPEQIAQEKRDAEERAQQAYESFLKGADVEYLTLEGMEKGGNLRFADNVFDPDWPGLAQKYRDLAKRLTSDETYGTKEAVVEKAQRAKDAATGIEQYVKLRTDLRKDIETARSTAVTELEKLLETSRKAFDEAVLAKEWVKAASAADPAAIEKIVTSLADQKVKDILPASVPMETRDMFGDDLLLDPQEHVQPLLEKYVPGDPSGQALVEQVLEQAREAHRETLKAAAASAAAGTPAGLDQAIEALEAYLEGLPDTAVLGEHPLASEIARFRAETEAALEAAQQGAENRLAADITHDRMAYFLLLKALRAPGAFLARFQLADALRVAEKSANAMRYPGYQELTAEAVDDVKALQRLLGRLAETFPDSWTDNAVTFVNARGKEDSERIKAVTPTSVTFGGEERTFTSLGPAWLLAKLFYAAPDKPRFAFEGEDHRGLAVLAELAIDYDRVVEHYQAYLRTLAPDRLRTQNAMRKRIGALPRERAVAEAWKLGTENLRAGTSTCDAHDPALLEEPEDFWQKDDHRKALTRAKAELNEQVMWAFEALATVLDAKYADTVWATVLGDKIPEGARWAGEVLPTAPEREPDKVPEEAPDKAPDKDPEKDPEKDPGPPADPPKAPEDAE